MRRHRGPTRDMSHSCSIYCLISHKHEGRPLTGISFPTDKKPMESPNLLNRGMGHMEGDIHQDGTYRWEDLVTPDTLDLTDN